MLTNYSDAGSHDTAVQSAHLQAFLWTFWTFFMIVFAALHWQFVAVSDQSARLLSLVIHTLLAGLIGLIVMTLIEMRLDPERFFAGDSQNEC